MHSELSDSGRMLRRLALLTAVLAVLEIVTRFTLKSYSMELEHLVVLNALTQKAPDDYPKQRIFNHFSGCLEEVNANGSHELYMRQLMRISHRLEKVQYLDASEVEHLLAELACN